jgi:acylphosphatase
MKKAKKFLVKGNVQGVGYRYFTILVAEKIGVNGYVRNLYNGNVEVYAIGTEEQLDELKNKLETGPSHAYVEEVVEEYTAIDETYSSFNVEY